MFRNRFGHLADDDATVSVTDQHDIGQLIVNDEIHDGTRRLGVGHGAANIPAMTGNGGTTCIVPPGIQPFDDPIP
ncbi:hypothetical protein NJB14191_42270 [Mycobacterium montefiorense]|nr:hypothetical protein NJB14191_42270 [Mycobacterium montefiorense]GKU50506.1 hypothetical protein NJB14195_17520 [Mycobacterium montefiorense]GKU64491.1 hypothetical protein NJB18182_49910 [Mycobacterium montefiorense]